MMTVDIPIILMSASDRMHRIVQDLEINDHLEKPFPLQVLYDTVACWC
jgi:CheY-like chemotaxis protein